MVGLPDLVILGNFMKKIHIRLLVISAVLLLPVGLTAFVIQHPALITAAELFRQVMDLTGKNYVKALPADSLYIRAARGMVRELNDPYSEVFSPKEGAQFKQALNGQYAGIGISIFPMHGGVVVQHVYPSTPAARSGLMEGDLIVQVDTADVRKGDSTRVIGKIKGPVGTTVSLEVVRPGVAKPLSISVVRQVVHVSAVPYTLLLENHVGYIPLFIFNERAGAAVNAAVAQLVHEGATRIVLDLRDNPGGFMDQAIAISSLFLPKGAPVVTMHSRAQGDTTFDVPVEPAYPTIPLAVLVNGNTASSSEIVSGALQDHDRASIVGTTTYGKGVGQTLFPLPDGYLLKLTGFQWLTPVGRSIQRDRAGATATSVTGLPADDPDAMESDSAIHARPTFKSDAGRTLYGGGGIVPDVVVRATRQSPEARPLEAALAKTGGLFSAVLAEYAAGLRGTLKANFVVTPAMRTAVIGRLQSVGVKLDSVTLANGRPFLDQMIGLQVASHLFGDSVAQRKYLERDAQLHEAVAVVRKTPENQVSLNAARHGSTSAPWAAARNVY